MGLLFQSPWLPVSPVPLKTHPAPTFSPPALPLQVDWPTWWEPYQESSFGTFDVIPLLTTVCFLTEAPALLFAFGQLE